LNAQNTENQSLENNPQETENRGTILNTLLNDWISLGNSETNRFDLGRLQPAATWNPSLEGLRLRTGVASNTRLHPHFFVRGYVAYGFRNQRLNYRGEAAWAFNNPVYHENEFPRNVLRFIYENDSYSFGDNNPRAPNDRLLFVNMRSQNAMTYRRFAELNYEKETLSGFAFNTWIRRSEITPAPGLYFSQADIRHNSLITSDIGITLRYAFGESFNQYRRTRRSTSLQSPVLFLSHTIGIDRFLGSTVGYHRTEFSAQKRFLLGTAGRLDVVGEAMRVWNAVPFPLLVYNNQHQRHLIEGSRFFLNHATEFMADEVYTLRFTFVGNDLLLSKIPVPNSLRLRESLGVRASYGRLSSRNESFLFDFPQYAGRYGNIPFVEGSIGLIVLGLLRVEYVHRFTYRDNLPPNAALGMVRVGVTL
jgi:hypothetical protein